MKKFLFTASLLIGLIFSANAQDISKNALGLRLGDNDGFGGEISYQMAWKTSNRLEFDLGWRSSKAYDAIKLVALHQWVWNIDGGFNWYAGIGGGLGTWSIDVPAGVNVDDSGFYALVAGDLGIEYNFDFPLQLSLDIRPEIYFNSDNFRNDNFGPDIALGIRYRW